MKNSSINLDKLFEHYCNASFTTLNLMIVIYM